LASQNAEISIDQFKQLISTSLTNAHDELVKNYVNGKTEAARQSKTFGELDLGKLAVEAHRMVTSQPGNFVGKMILKRLREEFKQGFNKSLQVGKISPHLKSDDLEQISKKVKKPAKAS